MNFPKRIAVAVDFSQASLSALAYGIELYQRLGSAFVAVHVIEPPKRVRMLPRGPRPVVLLEGDGGVRRLVAEKRLHDAAQSFRLEPSLGVRLLVCSGEPLDIICSATLEANASVLVVGRTGIGGAADMGSLARRLLESAPCPVIPIAGERRGARPHVT